MKDKTAQQTQKKDISKPVDFDGVKNKDILQKVKEVLKKK